VSRSGSVVDPSPFGELAYSFGEILLADMADARGFHTTDRLGQVGQISDLRILIGAHLPRL